MSKIIHKHIVYMYTSWTKLQHCFFRTTVKPQSGLHRYLFKLCTSQTKPKQNKTRQASCDIMETKITSWFTIYFCFLRTSVGLILRESIYLHLYFQGNVIVCVHGVCVWYKWCSKILINHQLPETWKQIKTDILDPREAAGLYISLYDHKLTVLLPED